MIATALLLAVVLQNPQAAEQGRDVRLIQYPVTPWVTAERSSLAESQALSALLQRWMLQPDGSSEAFSEDECLFGVTRADRIALAAVPQAHKRMQQLIAVQEKEAQSTRCASPFTKRIPRALMQSSATWNSLRGCANNPISS